MSTLRITDTNTVVDIVDPQTVVTVLEATTGLQGIPGPGVPAGGTSGQVLAKSSGTDYATGWVDQSGGGGTMLGVPVYMQQTTPAGSGWLWFKTDVSGNVIDILNG